MVVLSFALFTKVNIPFFILGGSKFRFISIHLSVLIQFKKPFAQAN